MINWLPIESVIQQQREEIARSGGPQGIRDRALLESALARPQNLLAYGNPNADLCDLAASLSFGIVTNHPFVDGNKRASFFTGVAFLLINGRNIREPDRANIDRTWRSLAGGTMSEMELAAWFRERIQARP
jgi:death-on-curing protein